jgi:hypothetical protein
VIAYGDKLISKVHYGSSLVYQLPTVEEPVDFDEGVIENNQTGSKAGALPSVITSGEGYSGGDALDAKGANGTSNSGNGYSEGWVSTMNPFLFDIPDASKLIEISFWAKKMADHGCVIAGIRDFGVDVLYTTRIIQSNYAGLTLNQWYFWKKVFVPGTYTGHKELWLTGAYPDATGNVGSWIRYSDVEMKFIE